MVSLRRRAGKTQAEVAAELGLRKSTYAAWEVGRNTFNVDQLIMLSEYFGCTPNDVLGWSVNHSESSGMTDIEYDGLSNEERRFLSLYNLLAPNNRASILDLMQGCTKSRRPKA